MERFVALLINLRNRHFLLADVLIFLTMPTLALELRVDGANVLSRYTPSLLVATGLFLAVKLGVFYVGGLYSRFWRYASIDELGHIAFLGGLAMLIQTGYCSAWLSRSAGSAWSFRAPFRSSRDC